MRLWQYGRCERSEYAWTAQEVLCRFHYEIEKHYQAKVFCSDDFLYARSHCTATIDDEALRVMSRHVSDVANQPQTYAPAQPSTSPTCAGRGAPWCGGASRPQSSVPHIISASAIIKDLVNKTQLNGSAGIVEDTLPNGRYLVKINTGASISVQFANLEFISQPRPSSSPNASGPAMQAISAGMFVVLKGLNTADLNDNRGIVQECLQNGRYVVETEKPARVYTKSANLEIIPQPSKAWVCRQCKVKAYWSTFPTPGWTGGKGKWKCPSCSAE